MFGYHGLELTIRLICMACALVVALIVGITGSVVLGYSAYLNGYPADLVFNVSGPLITLLTLFLLLPLPRRT